MILNRKLLRPDDAGANSLFAHLFTADYLRIRFTRRLPSKGRLYFTGSQSLEHIPADCNSSTLWTMAASGLTLPTDGHVPDRLVIRFSLDESGAHYCHTAKVSLSGVGFLLRPHAFHTSWYECVLGCWATPAPPVVWPYKGLMCFIATLEYSSRSQSFRINTYLAKFDEGPGVPQFIDPVDVPVPQSKYATIGHPVTWIDSQYSRTRVTASLVR